ncbi:MAG TPA: hypothetical protein VN442_11655, partial [Bryobacteraceae bacterium]|nr:hypothetical protein [Bryobacteraceae bacterium]
IPNFYRLETIGSEADWRLCRELLRETPRLQNGCLQLPCAPGFGVDLDESALARYPYSPETGTR